MRVSTSVQQINIEVTVLTVEDAGDIRVEISFGLLYAVQEIMRKQQTLQDFFSRTVS
jgi:hypothetical protein